MCNPSEFDAFVKERGYPLFGVADVCLNLSDALYAVKLAREAGLAILGGDVYLRKSGKIVLGYANWGSNRREGENEADFARRTWEQTEDYIQRFKAPEGVEPLFVLVRSS